MRYTLKVILNNKVVRCGSWDKEWIDRDFNLYSNLSYRDIFKMYGKESMGGILEIQMYKKNRNGRVDKNLPKKDFKNIVYNLTDRILNEEIEFEITYRSGKYTYVENKYILKDRLVFMEDEDVIVIHPETYSNIKDILPEGYNNVKHIEIK